MKRKLNIAHLKIIGIVITTIIGGVIAVGLGVVLSAFTGRMVGPMVTDNWESAIVSHVFLAETVTGIAVILIGYVVLFSGGWLLWKCGRGLYMLFDFIWPRNDTT